MSLRHLVCVGMALAACGVSVPVAGAAFDPPVELASGSAFGVSATSATDDRGGTVVVVRRGSRGLELVQRESSAASWAPAMPLPGRDLGSAVGPRVSAAGQGAAAVAWRIDSPKKYAAIGVVVRDPGAASFGSPAVASPADANGVRYPAVAVDPEGRAVLAYNTGTRAAHLSMRGAVAVSLRRGDGSFAAPVVVDARMSRVPAVAVGPDGRGVVAWVRDRRVWAVSVDAEAGTIGRVTAVTGRGAFDSVVAAAGKGGAATIAFRVREADHPRAPWAIGAVRRVAGRTFPAKVELVDVLGRQGFVRDVALAADEDGWTALAWSPERFSSPGGAGINGVTAGVRVAIAQEGETAFGRPRVVTPGTDVLCETPSLDASGGRALLAWTCRDGANEVVQASWAHAARIRAPETVLKTKPSTPAYAAQVGVTAGLDPAGIATLVITRPDPPTTPTPTTPPIQRVLAATGR